MTIGYLYSKFFKKILRGKSILNSKVDKKAKIYSGSQPFVPVKRRTGMGTSLY